VRNILDMKIHVLDIPNCKKSIYGLDVQNLCLRCKFNYVEIILCTCCQDFSKILVVLGLQNSGGRGGWYPYKANDKINRVKTNTSCQCYPFRSTWSSPKILSRGEFIFGRRGRRALMLPVPFKLEFAKILSRGEFIFGRRGRPALNS
jgi:hypothetical protein